MTQKQVFLCKTSDDVVIYVSNDSFTFECGHYFAGLRLCGATWCGGSSYNTSYDNVRTPLSRGDYERLFEIDKQLNALGYGLDKKDEERAKGYELCAEAKAILNDKLDSENSMQLWEEVKQEEFEYLKEKYNFSDKDIEDIFENYGNDYRDREVICAVFDSVEDCGREEAYSLGYIKRGDTAENYFNFEDFGQDLVNESEAYLELDGGRVVYLAY